MNVSVRGVVRGVKQRIGRIRKGLSPAGAKRSQLVKPKLPHRAVNVDAYPIGETTRSVRVAYERVFGSKPGPGVYRKRDWTRISFTLDQMLKDSTVLDVGPNRGQFVNVLAESSRFRRVVGADYKLSPNFLRLHSSLEYVQMNVVQLEFEDNAFDVVSCMEVLEHLEPELLPRALAELRRVCKKQLLISVPYAEALPIYKGHKKRFLDEDFLQLFPSGSFTCLQSAHLQWMHIEELNPP